MAHGLRLHVAASIAVAALLALPAPAAAQLVGFPAAQAPGFTPGGARGFAASQAPPFTVDQVLSAPFPTELVAAPTGALVAWTMFERGRRNIYVAEAPEFRPRRLTAYDQDDGQELTSLAFTGDATYVVYVRGGDHGSNWEAEGGLAPNPTSRPEQPQVQVWAVPVAGGDPLLVGEGDEPVPAPKSRRVAFVRDNRLWAAEVGGKAAQLFFARGRNASPAWSPDGRTLAFVSDRGDHSFIGLYSDGAEAVRYLAPGTSRDSRPVWSPDGRRIAFVRQPGRGGARRPPLEQTPQPWAIWVAEVKSGEGREVWRSGRELKDSVPRTLGGTNLNWGDGDRLVFLSYQDGWPHLYSVPAGGGSPLLLTPGAFMVEWVALAPDCRSVLYNANTGSDPHDVDRRHLFHVAIDQAAPVALTSGTGIEWSPLVTSDGAWLVYLGSDVQRAALPKAQRIDPAGGSGGGTSLRRSAPTARRAADAFKQVVDIAASLVPGGGAGGGAR